MLHLTCFIRQHVSFPLSMVFILSLNLEFQHAFPHDFRSGPSLTDWDPSKWIILTLHRLGFATGLRRARSDDIIEATKYMREKSMCGVLPPEGGDLWEGRVWTNGQLDEYIKARPGRCVVLIDGYAVDVTNYLGEHVRLLFIINRQ